MTRGRFCFLDFSAILTNFRCAPTVQLCVMYHHESCTTHQASYIICGLRKCVRIQVATYSIAFAGDSRSPQGNCHFQTPLFDFFDEGLTDGHMLRCVALLCTYRFQLALFGLCSASVAGGPCYTIRLSERVVAGLPRWRRPPQPRHVSGHIRRPRARASPARRRFRCWRKER